MIRDVSGMCMTPDDSVREAIVCIDKNEGRIALITDKKKRLIGTIVDGDIRRAIHAGLDLDTPVSKLLARKANSPYAKPITMPVGTDRGVLLKLMRDHLIRQIPLLDEDESVVGLITLDELLPNQVLPLNAVIMAGGFGTRLRPLTEEVPKPMLPIGERPLMELMVERLQKSGIRQVNVTTHYQKERIAEHFGDGQKFGVKINYVTEDRPLGTAGSLGLMEVPKEPLLVINGDILTGVDFRDMLDYHQEHNAAMTVAVWKYDVNVPYGVIESDGALVQGIVEKPVLNFFVNAGIYLLEPSVFCHISGKDKLDMPDLIQFLIDDGEIVVSFPIIEYWLDIGNHSDYIKAQEDTKNGKVNT